MLGTGLESVIARDKIENGLLDRVSLVLNEGDAGGSLTWENGNLLGKGRLLSASATTANFLNPSEDLGYQLTYRHPDLKGLDDPKRTEFNATVFNTRNASAVFSPGLQNAL